MKIKWQGSGLKEVGVNIANNKKIIAIDQRYLRPRDIDSLKGDYSKAKKILNWSPKISFSQMVNEMVEYQLKLQLNKNVKVK